MKTEIDIVESKYKTVDFTELEQGSYFFVSGKLAQKITPTVDPQTSHHIVNAVIVATGYTILAKGIVAAVNRVKLEYSI